MFAGPRSGPSVAEVGAGEADFRSHANACSAAEARRAPPAGCVLFLLVFAASGAARAQATSDRVPATRVASAAASVRADLQEDRYHLGPVRLFPFAEISDAGYNDNIFGTADHKVADWTADVAAGTRLLLPIGPKMFLRGTAAPEYIWYAHHPEGRTFGGDYGGALLGLFNHLRIDADARDTKTSSLLNAETLRNVLSRTRIGHASAEVDVAGPLSVFGDGEGARYRFEANPVPPIALEDPALLDRNEEKVLAGLRLHAAETLSFSASAEKTRAEFSDPAQGGDNRTTAYLLGVRVDEPRFFVNLSAGYREAEPIHDSRFTEFRTATGSYFVSFMARSDLELFLDGYRGAQYSVTAENPYYMETINGGGVNFQATGHLGVRVFGDYAENLYPVPVVVDGVDRRRVDRIGSFGGGFQIAAGRRLTVGVYATDYRYESNVPGVPRDVFRFTATVGFQFSPIVSIRSGLS